MKIRAYGPFTSAVLAMALTVISCNSPTAPEVPYGAVQSLHYEHVADFTIQSDTRIELEYRSCTSSGREGPIVCSLVLDSENVYRCPSQTFMSTVPTTCDSTVEVRFREPSGNPLFGTAHNIYVNGTKLSRLMAEQPIVGYPNEWAYFRLNADGSVR